MARPARPRNADRGTAAGTPASRRRSLDWPQPPGRPAAPGKHGTRMRTLILSSSLRPDSQSRQLCRRVEALLAAQPGALVDFVDLRDVELRPCHLGRTPSMSELAERVAAADNYVLGMGVHCYTVNDGLKIVLDTCMKGCEGKFFGVLCAAGGEKSYLSTMHLTQMCMNEWRMMQLPRVVYATDADFREGVLASAAVEERLALFAAEFGGIGRRLLA